MKSIKTVILKKEALRGERRDHLWIFSNEIASNFRDFDKGELVKIKGADGKDSGSGYINPNSLIAIRRITLYGEPEEKWVEERIGSAVKRRELKDCCRLIFGESDFLPGLVVDKYGNYLAIQILTAGMDRLSNLIVESLKSLLKPEGIVLRCDSNSRKLEGLPLYKKAIPESFDGNVIVRYLNLNLEINLLSGQKTGLFLDQQENINTLSKYTKKGVNALDIFAYSGAWGMHLLKMGASKATFIDSSREACKEIERNLAKNGLDKMAEVICSDAFEALKEIKRKDEKFDIIVSDPPAFAKSKKDIKEAKIAYIRLNKTAMDIIKKDGILVSCSCSYHISREDMRDILRKACSHAKRAVTILEDRIQPPDHPVLLSVPESEYLKCIFLKFIN